MRMRKKPNLIPRMERCSDYQIKDPKNWRGHWRELLAPGCSLRVELGCGKGRFTCETAAAEPEVLFIAIERVPDAMVIAMERAQAMGLKNVRFIDADVADLRDYFAPGEVERIYINFCDPWPTNRHARRRLTHPDFLERYRGVLTDGGEIHFKTDNRGLFEWSLFQFPKAGYELQEVTRDLHADGIRGVMTDYEEKFHSLGTPINRCVGVKQPREEGQAADGRILRILFVCHGNICRSPMAEFVMKDLTEQAGLAHRFRIASAATSTEEIGNPVYPPARRKLAEHGIGCAGKTARQLRREDYENWDLFVGMDEANLRNMRRLFDGDPEGKCSLLLDHTQRPGEVADPWYTGDFEATWQDVLEGCQALLAELT